MGSGHRSSVMDARRGGAGREAAEENHNATAGSAIADSRRENVDSFSIGRWREGERAKLGRR